MNLSAERRSQLSDFIVLYSLTPAIIDLLNTALTHKSYSNEARPVEIEHNQRLEFLGDGILSVIIARFLYLKHPDWNEGQLTREKARVVCEPTLVEVGKKLNIGELLLLGKGEEKSKGRERASNIADALEAVIGAIYLEEGLESAERFILSAWLPFLEGEEQVTGSEDYKSKLLEYLMKKTRKGPFYQLEKVSGPDHAREFTVSLFINRQKVATGSDSSIKKAEQQAAKKYITEKNL